MKSEELTTQVARLLESRGKAETIRAGLTPLVYEQLRAIAERRMQGERPGHTLQATALVHEALLRLRGDRNVSMEEQTHFFSAAAEAMRRVLIDHARKKGSRKRAGRRVLNLPDVLDLANDPDPGMVLVLDEALTRLAEEDFRAAEVVKLRFFVGLDVDATANALGISPRSVAREWAYARTRLYQLLTTSDSE